MKTQLTELNAFCKQLNQRHLILGVGLFFIDWACAWGLLAAWNNWISSFQEATAVILLGILCVLYLGSLYPLLKYYRRTHKVTLKRLAGRMEAAFPELNDLLLTATHLESRQLESPNPLEAYVMEDAGRRLRALDWKKAVTRPFERLSFVAGILTTGIVLFVAASQSVVMQKALHHIQDSFGESPTGLVFNPFPTEIAESSNVDIGFTIHRWQRQATIEWIDSSGENKEPVVVDETGIGLFTFYDMAESLQFRVVTPSLCSAWQKIEVYTPARMESLTTTISPPSYTRLPDQSIEGLSDIEAVEGSQILMRAASTAANRIELLMEERLEAMESAQTGLFEIGFQPERSTEYRLRLSDDAGRESETVSRKLTILTDNPPTVEILTPERDSVLAPGDIFPVEIFAADDFGLAQGRIRLALSGKDLDPVQISLANVVQTDEEGNPLPLKEATLASTIDLGALDAGDGDLLALHVVMLDNREPEANLTRTELLFIEIREPIEPIEMDGMPMEQKPIDFRELIEEQKRLLRETHRLDLADNTAREQMMLEIPAGLSALAVEIQRIFNEVEAALVSANRMDLSALFMRALSENGQAIQAFENGEVDDSLTPQAASLSALLKLENAFRQNTKSKEPAKGSSGEGESGEQDEQQEQGPDEGKSVTEALKEAKEQLDELLRKQNALVAEYDRASRSGWSGEQAAASAQNQVQLGDETRTLRRSMASLSGSESASQALGQARQHMESASEEAGEADAAGALRDGFRAREALRKAAGELAAMIADAATRELEAAAETANKLAEEQLAAAESSEQAGDNTAESELAGMEENQRDLKERFEDLLEEMTQQARQSAGTSPQLGEALREAARNAGQRGTASNMERAANALLYGQPGMAAPMQSTAAGQISQLAKDLQEASEQIANDPARRAQALNRELQMTLEELQSHARNPEDAPKERLSEIQEEWSTRFMELQQLSGLPQFGSLSGQIAGGAEAPWDQQLSTTRGILQEGAGLLQAFLFNEGSQSNLQMNRDSAPPPDQYRKMVEEYFRRLAREPEK